MFDIIIIANITIRVWVFITLGSAKLIMNAGLKLFKAHDRKVAVCLFILLAIYASFANFAPIGQPQNIPHMIIKTTFSLNDNLVIRLNKKRGLEKAFVYSNNELIIVNGSREGKIVNNHRLRPFNAYILVRSIFANIKKNIKNNEKAKRLFLLCIRIFL